MESILNKLAESTNGFAPQTVDQYLALRIARKLDDIGQLHRYVMWADKYSREQLLNAYRSTDPKTGEAFAAQLSSLNIH